MIRIHDKNSKYFIQPKYNQINNIGSLVQVSARRIPRGYLAHIYITNQIGEVIGYWVPIGFNGYVGYDCTDKTKAINDLVSNHMFIR
jgi:exosome complex RNA-binding protein Rrp4